MSRRVAGGVLFLVCVVLAGVGAAESCKCNAPLIGVRISLTIDLSHDDGRNIGTLFELRDSTGRAVAGAGVVSVSNSNVRGDRMQLSVFARPDAAEGGLDMHWLPRPNADAGQCIFTLANQLYSYSYRNENTDRAVRRLDQDDSTWHIDDNMLASPSLIRGGVLQRAGNKFSYDGQTILNCDVSDGAYAQPYYAAGHLIMLNYDPAGKRLPRLLAAPWSPGQLIDLDSDPVPAMELSHPQEFPYCYGQLGASVLVGTSRGAILAFDGDGWRTIRATNVDGRGSQFYSMINYDDRLLIGHYPSGRLWSWNGRELIHLKDSPPVPKSASRYVREAQSLFIHGGELYVGLWPWGEVWRLSRERMQWVFVTRLFSGPPMRKDLRVPFATEMAGRTRLGNDLGQRVLGMAALGDALIVSTSAKSSNPSLLAQSFLPRSLADEYGSVIRLRAGHNLAAALTWSPDPVRVEVQFQDRGIRVSQDGRTIGELPLSPNLMGRMGVHDVQWGRGVFGRCEFPLAEMSLTRAADS